MSSFRTLAGSAFATGDYKKISGTWKAMGEWKASVILQFAPASRSDTYSHSPIKPAAAPKS
jgi:hypothetical protein